jgi:hypothetical protein
MSLEWQARSGSLAWSNPVSWWWGLLTLVSGVNIAVWFVLYRELPLQPAGAAGATSSIGLMLLFCAAYVFGCAFRSFLPHADVQRICLFDTWWSSVLVGRTVATLAEIAFVAQWAILLHQLGTMTGAETTVNAAWVLWAVAFFIIGVGLCRLLPEFHGLVRVLLAIAIAGIAGFLAFLMTIDVPMYLRRWRTGDADGDKRLTPREGLRDVSTRWVVTHDLAEWKDEIVWMSLYFSLAVWSSLALCVLYAFENHLPQYRTEAAIVSDASSTIVVGSTR